MNAEETKREPEQKPAASTPSASRTAPKPAAPKNEFYRAATEDDDGYDPYSDRRPEPEPLFERDPWN